MLISKLLRNIALAVALAYLGAPSSLLAQGSPDIIWERKVNIDRVNSVIFTPNGQTLISGGSDRLINFWRVSDGALLQTLNTNSAFVHASAIESLSISADGGLLASCSYKTIQLWSLPDGTERKINGHTDWVVGVCFSPDGNLVASASFDTTIGIWRASDGSLVKRIQGVGQQRCLAFSPDGNLLATGAGDNAVKLWQTSDWTLVRTLSGHTDDLFTVAFSPDGTTIASGGYDDTVKLWNVSDGALKFTFSGNGGNVYGLAFTPDGTRLAYTDGEGSTIKIYRIADGTLVRTFTEDVNEVQTVAFSGEGLLGYGRVDTTVVLARIDGTATPRARITSPTNGRIYNAPANITLTASPSKADGTITKMEFFQNGILLGEDVTSPFTFPWNNVVAGTYTLTAVDTDILGATTVSSPITINVVNQTSAPPTITITNPKMGGSFNVPANITIAATASADAGVESVEFFQNGISLGQDTTSPFGSVWSSVAIGNYSLTAVVTDKNGAKGTSSSINITIQEAPPETTKPRVAITSPAAGVRLTTPEIILNGTANDNVGVAQVLYSLNSVPFESANGTLSWDANVTLVPGVNNVQVKSLDTSGNESAVVSRSFTYVVSAPLLLQINGLGTVTPLEDGQILEVGKTYTIKAAPSRDYIFNGWTGSVTTNAANFSFTMRPNTSLSASFVPNPFVERMGTYLGLIQSPTPSHDRSGFIQINVTRSGTFSGRITLGREKYSLNGKFNGDGSFTGKHSLSTLTLELLLDLESDSNQVTGSISDGTFNSTLVGNRLVFSRNNPAPQAGQYTILIPPNSSRNASPQGPGYGILRIDGGGKTRIAGSLADGTKFSQNAGISKNSTWSLYAHLYGGSGSISGNLKFRNQPGVSDLDGTVNWFRPVISGAKMFANGFTTQTTLLGSAYVKPSGEPVLIVPSREQNVLVNLGEGGLESELQQPATLEVNNQFVLPPSNEEKLRLTFSASSGALRGSFIHPVTRRIAQHSGVVFQKQNLAEGYFLGVKQSGFVSVVPADSEISAEDDAADAPVIIPNIVIGSTTNTTTTPTPPTKKRKGH